MESDFGVEDLYRRVELDEELLNAPAEDDYGSWGCDGHGYGTYQDGQLGEEDEPRDEEGDKNRINANCSVKNKESYFGHKKPRGYLAEAPESDEEERGGDSSSDGGIEGDGYPDEEDNVALVKAKGRHAAPINKRLLSPRASHREAPQVKKPKGSWRPPALSPRKGKQGRGISVDAVIEYYCSVLQWSIQDLLAPGDSRLPLSAMPASFDRASLFYAKCKELVMEESFACLQTGLHKAYDFAPIYLRRSLGTPIKKCYELITVMFEISSQTDTDLRPGCTFLLSPQIKTAGHPPKSGVKDKSGLKPDGVSSDLKVIATVAQNRDAVMSKLSVALWVHSIYMPYFSENSNVWVAREIGNLISYQRMASVCLNQPRPRYILKILGCKEATHIKFDETNSESESSTSSSSSSSSSSRSSGSSSSSSSRKLRNSSRCSTFVSDNRAPAPQSALADTGFRSREGAGTAQVNAISSFSGDTENKSLIVGEHVAESDDASIISIESHGDDDHVYGELNPSQRVAFDAVIEATCKVGAHHHHLHQGSGEGTLSLVQGPPGCGKSFFLAALLEHLVSKEKRVLVCAPSNKAVCVILELFMKTKMAHRHSAVLVGVEEKLGVGSMDLDPGGLLTGGIESALPRTSPSMLEGVPQYSRERLFSRRSNIALDRILTPKVPYDLYAYRIGDRIAMALEFMAQDLKTEIAAMQAKSTSELKVDILKFKQFLAEFRKLILYIANQISQASSREIISVFSKIETKFEGVEPISSFSYSTFLGNNAAQLLSIAADVIKISKMIADPLMAPQFASEAVASADIVFCTLASSGQSVVRRFLDIDVLLVDEAAQALEPELCIPFSLFPKHLVLVGDPAQLPATLLSVRAQKMQRADSTMKRLMLRCKSPYHMLKTQYRMHPDISQLPNKLFYDNQISDSKHVSSRACIFNVSNASPDIRRVASFPWLQNYSVVNIVGKEVRKGSSHHASVSNMEEAGFVARLLAFFCVSFPHLDHANQICVISFYTGQVQALKDQIMREATRHNDTISCRLKRIRVVTVDSFQGSESDIVVLSFVRSNPANNVGFLNDFSRINVATTRAKFLMVAVGNAATLERSGLPYLNSLITDARVRGKLFESTTIDAIMSSMISSK